MPYAHKMTNCHRALALAALLSLGCESADDRARRESSSRATAPETPPPPPTGPDPAKEVLEAIGGFYVPAQRLAEVSSTWDHCHDDGRNIDEMIACAERIRATADAAHAWLRQRKRTATTECAKQIEEATVKFAEAQALFAADLVAWLKTNRTKIATLLARGTFPEMCNEATIGCAAMPFERLGYGRVNSLSCTDGMFECKPVILARGKCEFPDLTSRLGVVSGEPKGPVTARGRPVTLNWEEPPWAKP